MRYQIPRDFKKTCVICFVDKPLEDFHKLSRAPDGRRGTCKSCQNALLARLEAALGTDCYANGDCVLCKVHHERYIAWRRAAGKS